MMPNSSHAGIRNNTRIAMGRSQQATKGGVIPNNSHVADIFVRSKSQIKSKLKNVMKSRLSANYCPPGAGGGMGMTRLMERRYQIATEKTSPRGLGVIKDTSIQQHLTQQQTGPSSPPPEVINERRKVRKAETSPTVRDKGSSSNERPRGDSPGNNPATVALGGGNKSQIQYCNDLQKRQEIRRQRVKEIVEKLTTPRRCARRCECCALNDAESKHSSVSRKYQQTVFKASSVLQSRRIPTSQSSTRVIYKPRLEGPPR
jgi:hypothetical protein